MPRTISSPADRALAGAESRTFTFRSSLVLKASRTASTVLGVTPYLPICRLGFNG